ncbi:substrate-binding periplasmic protein [Paracoccus sp. R86501]|uniref:substrate-binding periplasmic protein n=1 Tax=Paracoccus sp. R86501 TaxID=3101711 RepID=UPI00366DBF38
MTIGVRVDAGPFARHDPYTEKFRGYLVDLCREAVTRAGFTFIERPVTARQRMQILEGRIDVSAQDQKDEALGPWTLDLLCDPTTLSLKRLDTFAVRGDEVLAFSPVVFVANGSFVTLKERKARGPDNRSLAGDCPPSGMADEPLPGVFIAGHVQGTTSETVIRRAAKVANNQVLCLWAAESHVEAVAALCRGEIDYYFGDLDIIEFYRSYRAETGANCAKTEPPRTVLSYEPYALLVSNNTPGFRPRFLAALYELFSDGTAEQRFTSHFGGASPSTALNLLFRINSVPGLRDK